MYNDFGQDFISLLETIGFQVSLRETSKALFGGGYTALFIIKKIIIVDISLG